MKIQYSAKTDVGMVRTVNQDFYSVLDSKNIFVVCDGMGGGAAGDFASHCATDIIIESYKKMSIEDISGIIGNSSLSLNRELFRPIAAMRLANKGLFNLTQKYPKLAGMGTTIVMVMYDEIKNLMHIYHVGDSRVYRFRNGIMEQLTKDHSKINELLDLGKMSEDDVKTAEIQSMITRALGISSKVKIDYRTVTPLPRDNYVVFTDGLNTMLEDDVIKKIVLDNIGNTEEITGKLVAAANDAGGHDNTTVITLKMLDDKTANLVAVGNINQSNVVTINEETHEQSLSENRFLKTLFKGMKIDIPNNAMDKGIFGNPLIVGVMLAVILIISSFVITGIKDSKHDTELNDLTGKVSGILFDVRTPNLDQMTLYNKSEDYIQRLQIIQDCYQSMKINTIPLAGVKVIILSDQGKVFEGESRLMPLEISLNRGSYEVLLKSNEYTIITNKLKLKNKINITVELSSQLKSVDLIMIKNTGGNNSGE